MEIDFATWPDGVTTKEFAETAETLELSSEMNRFEQEIKVTLTVSKTDEAAIVDGHVLTQVKATCARCLKEFEIEVGEEFRRIGKLVDFAQADEDTGDPDYVFLPYSQAVWNLNEQIREVILLAVSDNPLCDENCRGLCPRCGQNLNTKECGCDRGRSNAPRASLKDFLDQWSPRTR